MKIAYKFFENSASGELIEEISNKDSIDVELFPKHFIDQLKGKQKGDSFSFLMKSKDGFGQIDVEKIQDMPLEDFLVDGEIPEEFSIGNFVELIDEKDNSQLCIILEISGNVVKMDFNHPLAGVDVFVQGEIIEA